MKYDPDKHIIVYGPHGGGKYACTIVGKSLADTIGLKKMEIDHSRSPYYYIIRKNPRLRQPYYLAYVPLRELGWRVLWHTRKARTATIWVKEGLDAWPNTAESLQILWMNSPGQLMEPLIMEPPPPYELHESDVRAGPSTGPPPRYGSSTRDARRY